MRNSSEIRTERKKKNYNVERIDSYSTLPQSSHTQSSARQIALAE